jgi:hypothetical protein
MLSQQIPLKMSRLRSKTKKESHQISRDLSLLESNLKMEELFQITTSKKNQLFTWSLDLEEVCKSLLRLLLERPLLSMLSQQTPLKMSRLKSKIKKESHQISKDSSSLESNLKTEEPSPTITFKKNQLFIWFSDLEEVCKSSSKLLLEKPSLLMLNQQTPLKMLKLKSKIKKESHQISKDSFSLESNLKMEELFQTTTFKKSQLSTWFSDLEEVCKSSSRLLLEKPSLLMLSQLTPLKTSRPKSKTKKEFHQISKDLSSLESNLKMEEPFLTTTSKKNPLFI